MFSTYSRNRLGIDGVFFYLFVPFDSPTHMWVDWPMVTILLDFHTILLDSHTSLISLHNNPLNTPDISWNKGAIALCNHQAWSREDIFWLSTLDWDQADPR